MTEPENRLTEHDEDYIEPAPRPGPRRVIVAADGPDALQSSTGEAPPRMARRRRSPLLDIGLVVLGVAVVAGLIWALTANASVTPSAGSANAPGSVAGAANSGPIPTASIGQPAPDFSLPATDGKTYSLSQFRGKAVVLEFMAPWCPHCQNAAPQLNDLYAHYQAQGAQFLSVSATPYDRHESGPISMDELVWFHDTYQVAFPLLFDAKVTIGPNLYGVTGFPFFYVIDRNGIIRAQPNFATDIPAALEQALK